MYKYVWYCRWCGITYRPNKQTERDGFCSSMHKQAHYRSYKKYVTLQAHVDAELKDRKVTRKRRKKNE